MHQNDWHTALGRQSGHARVICRAPDVVQHVCACVERRGGYLGLGRIDADRHVRQRGTDRPHDGLGARELFSFVDDGVPGSGRFAADVEHVRSLLGHHRRFGQCRRNEVAAVGGEQPIAAERVGRDVDDAHHERAAAPDKVGATNPGRLGWLLGDARVGVCGQVDRGRRVHVPPVFSRRRRPPRAAP